jgi:hypothetical protein
LKACCHAPEGGSGISVPDLKLCIHCEKCPYQYQLDSPAH